MEKDEKMMTGEESLRIITEMINKTKTNIRQGSFHLIFWGWLILLCSLGQYLMFKFTNLHAPWRIWMLIFPGILVSMIYGWKNGRKEHIHTYADTIYLMTWIGFTVVVLILLILLHGKEEMIPQLILLITGLPTFISGFILKFRPLILGGITFWVLSLLAFFAGPSIAPVAVPVAMLTGYLIPGYMLRRKDSHDTI
jgi:hypothetical protein